MRRARAKPATCLGIGARADTFRTVANVGARRGDRWAAATLATSGCARRGTSGALAEVTAAGCSQRWDAVARTVTAPVAAPLRCDVGVDAVSSWHGEGACACGNRSAEAACTGAVAGHSNAQSTGATGDTSMVRTSKRLTATRPHRTIPPSIDTRTPTRVPRRRRRSATSTSLTHSRRHRWAAPPNVSALGWDRDDPGSRRRPARRSCTTPR